MPLDILGQKFVLLAQLLRAALAEEALPGIVGFADELRRMGLRDGDERHPLGQFGPHTGQTGCGFRHVLAIWKQK